jgi:hypothetical protein
MRKLLPDFPDIAIEAWATTDDGQKFSVCYVGAEADLLAAGVLTADLLTKRDPKAPRPNGGRRDADGDRVDLHRWNIVRAGVVVPRIRARLLNKSITNARKLPGFAAAREAWIERERELAASEAEDRKCVEQRNAALQDPEFQTFVETFQKLSPERKRDIERHMRYLANKHTRRLAVVVDNTR